jgi:flagellar FliJ protein
LQRIQSCVSGRAGEARALVSAQDAAEQARRERDALAELHATSRAEVDAAHRTEPRIGHLQQLGLVLQSLDQRLESAGENVRAADDIVADAQKLLETAARDRRILDRLKDRTWSGVQRHTKSTGMDEVALARFSRNADACRRGRGCTRSDDVSRESPA